MKYSNRLIMFIFPFSIFIMMFDRSRIYPNIDISIYRIFQLLMLFVIIIFLLMSKSLKLNLNNPSLLFLIGIIFIFSFTTLFSIDVTNSMTMFLRMIPLIGMSIILFFFLKKFWKEEYWIYITFAMFLSGVISSISIITDYFGITRFFSLYQSTPTAGIYRLSGILEQVCFTAGKLTIFLPFTLLMCSYYNYRNKLIHIFFSIFGLFIILFAILLTGTRMGGIIAIITLIIFIFKSRQVFFRFKNYFIILLIIACIVLTNILLLANHDFSKIDFILNRYKNLNTYIITKGTEVADFSLLYRLNFFLAGINIFIENPITGIGLSNYRHVSGNYGASYSDYSHNTFISILAETGIIGFIMFTGLCIQIWKDIYYYYKKNKKLKNKEYEEFYFFFGLSFVNTLLMLFFLSNPGNKYFWGMFVPFSMFLNFKKKL